MAFDLVTGLGGGGGGGSAPGLEFDFSNLTAGHRLLFVTSTTITPSSSFDAIVTVVGAGAGGGIGGQGGANGGGAGGLCQSLLTLSASTTYTITVAAMSTGTFGGASSFSGSGITTMTANGGSNTSGGSASGGNIKNNTGGSGGTASANFLARGGGAIGVLGNGNSAGASAIGASIDFIPPTFNFSEAFGWQANGEAGNPSGGHFGGYGEAAYYFGTKIGAKGGVGSGGGAGGGYSAVFIGGGGGFPGGGGGGAAGDYLSRGFGAQGCVVIEVI
jgi:hypothetical protein